MAATTPVCEFGWQAKPFRLQATDGSFYELEDVRGENGTLIMFICNHCPYVKSIIGRLVKDVREVMALGIGAAAICSNDAQNYPADSFPEMKKFAEQNQFPFPYLHDETQQIAKAYDAICTPDFFGFDKDLGLQYRGRFDAAGSGPEIPNARRELFEAMEQIAKTGAGPVEQVPSIGCSIKWKAA